MAKKQVKKDQGKKAPASRKNGTPKKPAAYDSEGRPTDTHLNDVLNEITAGLDKKIIEEDVSVECPYCGEALELHVTSAEEGLAKSESCSVCSRVMSISVHVDDDELQVSAYRA